MNNYEFAGTLFRTKGARDQAIAADFLLAGGLNSPEEVVSGYKDDLESYLDEFMREYAPEIESELGEDWGREYAKDMLDAAYTDIKYCLEED